MFWRLFLAYSVLLALSLGLLGWTVVRRMEGHLLEEVRQSLEMKTVLVRELAAGQPLHKEELQQQVRRVAEETRSRITLLDGDGRVLADSAEEPAQMENHLDRPEVRQAAATGIGTATRHSDTLLQPMMYLARRCDGGPVRYVRLALPLGAIEQEARWVRGAVWTAVGMTLLLALLLSLVLARRMSSPLTELAAAARSVAQGAYGQRVEVASQDEVGTLAVAFNDMSQACAAHIARMEYDRERLRAIFRSMVEGVLVLDVDQRIEFFNEAASQFLNLPPEAAEGRKLWQLVRHHQLSQAVEQVLAAAEPYHCELEWNIPERRVLAMQGTQLPGTPARGAVLVLHDITHLRMLERVRQDFVANVSHELKTPLATIQATVETLLDGALSDPNHNVRFLERIRESAERLHRLVQDLLTLGRVESGQETMDVQLISVSSAVIACLTRLEPRAAVKQLRLEQEPPAHAVTILGDDEALAEILDNLVDNAIKYTPAGGRVALRWFADGAEAVLQVEDTGVGIPERDLPRIFERFYRVDKARSRELGGTGLGLSIVKHLAQALGGSVTATSQVHRGSTFTVRLPAAVQGQEEGKANAIYSA